MRPPTLEDLLLDLLRSPLWEGVGPAVGLHALLLAALVGGPILWEHSQVRLPVAQALMVELTALPQRAAPKAAGHKPPEAKGRLREDRGRAATKTVAQKRQGEDGGRGGAREETVSLASGGKYRGYLSHIKARLERGWETAEGVKGGKLVLLFSVERNGEVSRVKLLASSGDKGLDRSALAAVRRVSPFDPMPRSMALSRLNVKAGFCYRVAAQ